ncbi:daunorubicin resistance protein DrrA family ABC transporter ATP-binding protein [Actinokineospora sp. NBRC 105648]|nr:daunorubicin resistance protein DrrA family ABC transporter ATP-binding protein [Actinokineospora sp. NBRC 105648]
MKRFANTPALRGIDLDIPTGSVFALLGPNGAGKTTIVRVLTTLLRPDSGRAWVNGWEVGDEPEKVRASVGVAGQYSTVDRVLTGHENVLLIAKLRGIRGRAGRAATAALLSRFRLTDAAHRPVGTYSGGMRRRLDLAAALVGAPPLVVLDEPTTGLDPESRLDTWDAIAELTASGATVLLTTQYLEEADRLADLITVIDGGLVVAAGTADELKAAAGRSRLVLCVATDADIAPAVRAAARAADATPTVDRRVRRVEVAVADGQDAVGRALVALAAEGVRVLEIGLTRPTLDDVFLGLTAGDRRAVAG